MVRVRRTWPPNTKLTQARLAQPSPSGNGQPMTRQELAQAINDYLWTHHHIRRNLDAKYITKLENGTHIWPHHHYRQAFRTVLHAQTDSQLGFHPTRQPRNPQPPPPDHTALALRELGDPAVRGFETDRRTVAALIAATLVGAGSLESLRLANAHAPSMGRGLVAAHAEVGDMLAGMYRSVDPRVVLPMATAYADDLLDQYDGADSAEFSRLVVDVHAQVGLWACHANRSAHAQRYLATACEVAASTQDPVLHARALGALSYLYSSAPRGGAGGSPRRALDLLDTAVAMSAGADLFTRGWLATWRADQHATLDHLEEARADIELAAAALDVGDDGQTSGFFSRRYYGYGMRGHLDSVRAFTLGLAGRTDEAERAFATVQAHAANGRRRAASYAHQALACAKAPSPDPEAACEALRQSIEHATSTNYAMGIQRVVGVRSSGFARSWASLRCVQAVDEQLGQLAQAR